MGRSWRVLGDAGGGDLWAEECKACTEGVLIVIDCCESGEVGHVLQRGSNGVPRGWTQVCTCALILLSILFDHNLALITIYYKFVFDSLIIT